MSDRRARWVVVAAVVAAYATSFAGGFQLDDWRVVVGDPRVQDLGAWWASMPGIRPLLKLSYALDHRSGLGLAAFHVTNLSVHVVSAMLAYTMLRHLGLRAGGEEERARWAALFGTLVFALHPVQTEAVTYISGRSASLSGMLVLASSAAWVRELRLERGRWPRVGSALLFGAAVAVKETALFLPLGLLVLAATDPRPERPRWRAILASMGPHLVVALTAALAMVAGPTYRQMLAESFALRSPARNVGTHLAAFGWLLGQVVRPDRLDADPDLPPVLHLEAWGVAIGIALAVIVAAAVLLRRRRPVFALAALWFVVWLAPTGWLVPRLEPASDRQLYLALLGPAWLIGWGISASLSRRSGPVLRWGAVGAIVVVLGGMTSVRSLVYRDEVRFWSDVVSKSPANARAHNNLAVALAAGCRRVEAEAELIRALERDPGLVRAAVNLRLLREGATLDPRAKRCP